MEPYHGWRVENKRAQFLLSLFVALLLLFQISRHDLRVAESSRKRNLPHGWSALVVAHELIVRRDQILYHRHNARRFRRWPSLLAILQGSRKPFSIRFFAPALLYLIFTGRFQRFHVPLCVLKREFPNLINRHFLVFSIANRFPPVLGDEGLHLSAAYEDLNLYARFTKELKERIRTEA